MKQQQEKPICHQVKQKKWYQLIFRFIRQQFGNLLLISAGIVLFLIVFDLYQLNLEPLFYAAGLYLLLAALVFFLRFVRYYKKHRACTRLMNTLHYDRNNLPPPETLAEEDYQEMIRFLGAHCSELSTAWQTEKQESLDYYTTWVHQIKTPIAAMQMTLQAEDTREHRALSNELFRIEQYVEMVLSYIRLHSDTNDFVFQEYDLDALIRHAIRKYAPQFIQRKIKLIYEPVPVSVLTDEKWLLFILEQLLSNAIKYTYQGSVTIRVTPDKKLTVSDTGIGIAPEDLPRIFEKGFTGYNGRTYKKSTGLGLYLCKQAADKLSISLTAVSAPGQGSSFTLDLAQAKLEIE